MKLNLALIKQQGEFFFDVSFGVEGKRLGIFGPSGSGKTTLMHMLAGLVRPDYGRIALDDEVLFDNDQGIDLPPEKRRIGVVFQHAHLFPHMGVEQNLLYGYKRTPKNERKIDPEALIEVLGLRPLLDRGVNTLSGGERQRVAIGRTVLSCPRLILLDEPLTGLDEKLKYQIIPYLKRVFTEFGIPFLLISHSLNEIRLMTDQVLAMDDGSLVDQTTAEVLALERLGSSKTGYINLLELSDPKEHDGLFHYAWGDEEIVIVAGGKTEGTAMFELSSKDVTLFKRDPEATSARNMLHCRVSALFESGNRVGVELDCGGGKSLVSQVVGEAARDLGLEKGSPIVAVIKASSFRRLY